MKSLFIALLSFVLLSSNVFATEGSNKKPCKCPCKTHAHTTTTVNDKSAK